MWCDFTSTTMQLPLSSVPLQENVTHRSPSSLRSLDSLSGDYARFLTEGRGDLKKAKEYNNVISAPFFKIPLDQVC